MENKNKKENIVNASSEALNEPIKEDVEEVNLETSKDSKEKKERTYSPSKVFKELKTVKWPTFKELISSSGLVIVFTVLFGLYFFVCEFLSSGLVKMIVGA